jgi:hypothetical protein
LDFQRPIYITLDGYENKYIVPGSLGSAFWLPNGWDIPPSWIFSTSDYSWGVAENMV